MNAIEENFDTFDFDKFYQIVNANDISNFDKNMFEEIKNKYQIIYQDAHNNLIECKDDVYEAMRIITDFEDNNTEFQSIHNRLKLLEKDNSNLRNKIQHAQGRHN